MNAVLTYVPDFEDSAYVGYPPTAILDWCMGTPAGLGAFRHPMVDAMLTKIISAWCQYLTSAASLHVINDSARGWKSVRRLRAGTRPVAARHNDKVLISPCEAVTSPIPIE
jgi:phosphatidylserine decarboxylase